MSSRLKWLQEEEKLLVSANRGENNARENAEQIQNFVETNSRGYRFNQIPEYMKKIARKGEKISRKAKGFSSSSRTDRAVEKAESLGRSAFKSLAFLTMEEKQVDTEDRTPAVEVSVSSDGLMRVNPYHLGIVMENGDGKGQEFDTFKEAARDIKNSEEHEIEGLETLDEYLEEGLLLVSSQDPEPVDYIGSAEQYLEEPRLDGNLNVLTEEQPEEHANLIEAKAEDSEVEGYDKHVIVGPYTPGVELGMEPEKEGEDRYDSFFPFYEFEDSSGDRVLVEFHPSYSSASEAKYER